MGFCSTRNDCIFWCSGFLPLDFSTLTTKLPTMWMCISRLDIFGSLYLYNQLSKYFLRTIMQCKTNNHDDYHKIQYRQQKNKQLHLLFCLLARESWTYSIAYKASQCNNFFLQIYRHWWTFELGIYFTTVLIKLF